MKSIRKRMDGKKKEVKYRMKGGMMIKSKVIGREEGRGNTSEYRIWKGEQ